MLSSSSLSFSVVDITKANSNGNRLASVRVLAGELDHDPLVVNRSRKGRWAVSIVENPFLMDETGEWVSSEIELILLAPLEQDLDVQCGDILVED